MTTTTKKKRKRLSRAKREALIDEIWAERKVIYKETGNRNLASCHRLSELMDLMPREARYYPCLFGFQF